MKLLVALDDSPAAAAALRLALHLAAPDGEVLLAHAIDRVTVVAQTTTGYGGDPTPVFEALEEDERDLLDAAAERARTAGVACSALSLDGPAAAAIASTAADRHVDAIAMGTHGRKGLARMILGSTTSAVLHAGAAPVFVVGDEAAHHLDGAFRSVFVALDGSPAVDEARGIAAARGVACDAAVLQGHAEPALLASAETVHADLIALGAHARPHGILGMGSVTAAIVAASRVPVLVVPAAR